MKEEEKFLLELKCVVIHFIKHDRKLYNYVVHVVEAQDTKTWPKLSDGQKVQLLEEVVEALPAFDAYYASYPHQWSRKRYGDFRNALGAFYKSLTGKDIPE